MARPHTIQTVGAVMMILGSLALLYPRMIHPVLSNMFSSKSDSGQEISAEEYMNPRARGMGAGGHPARAMNAFPGGGGGMPRPHVGGVGEMPAQMRGDPRMGRESRSTTSGRSGVTAMVLPIYAVGIIGYLLYIVFKVFVRKQKSDGGPVPFTENRVFRERLRRVRYDGDNFNLGNDFRDDMDVRHYLSRQRRQNELGESLARATEAQEAEKEDMEVLRARLAETEAQMARIMQAMNTAQGRLDQAASDAIQQQQLKREVPKKKLKIKKNVRKSGVEDVKQINTEQSADNEPTSAVITEPEGNEKDTENVSDVYEENTEVISESEGETDAGDNGQETGDESVDEADADDDGQETGDESVDEADADEDGQETGDESVDEADETESRDSVVVTDDSVENEHESFDNSEDETVPGLRKRNVVQSEMDD